MDRVNLTSLEIVIVGLQCNGKPIVYLSLLSHFVLPTNRMLWYDHLLIYYLTLNSVVVGITVWCNCKVRMLHVSASLTFPMS